MKHFGNVFTICLISCHISDANAISLQMKLKQVNQVGNNDSPSRYYPLEECKGDCDNNDDCMGNLICYQREPYQGVPNCDGGEAFGGRADFCICPEELTKKLTALPTTAAPSSSLRPSLSPMTLASPTSSAVPSPAIPEVTVGVYYYPWHHDRQGVGFHGRKYLRQYLQQPQLRLLGEYDDRDPAVIAQHVQWSRSANINLWVTSWWGPGDETDVTTKTVIMPHKDMQDMKIALFYETRGLITDYTTGDDVYKHISYIVSTYFHHANYYRIDHRPVLFVYLTTVLDSDGISDEVTAKMRRAALDNGGYDLYIVGDQVHFSCEPSRSGMDYKPFSLLDTVTTTAFTETWEDPMGMPGGVS
jgi:hypothetical protein